MEQKLKDHSPQWLSIVEYARAFGVSDMTVRRKIKTGKLQHEMRGNKYFIRVTDAFAFASSENTTTQKKPVSTDVETIQSPISNEQNEIPGSHLQQKVVASKESRFSEAGFIARNIASPTAALTQTPVAAHLAVPVSAHAVHQSSEVSVEAENLLKLCNTIIADGKKKETLMQSKFAAENRALVTKIRNRDIEIAALKRQLEDMQLLIKMLESK